MQMISFSCSYALNLKSTNRELIMPFIPSSVGLAIVLWEKCRQKKMRNFLCSKSWAGPGLPGPQWHDATGWNCIYFVALRTRAKSISFFGFHFLGMLLVIQNGST